jgi:DNA-binding MarR family transcriptional regulator
VGNTPDQDVAALPTLTLAVAARLLERSLDDMTLPQFRVLALIASSPERAGRIATLAGVSRPSLTGVLDGLTQRGWVRRVEVDGDRRGVSLEITDEGRSALAGARTDTGTRLDEVLDHLAPEDRRAALDGLAALGRAFQAERTRRYATEVVTP